MESDRFFSSGVLFRELDCNFRLIRAQWRTQKQQVEGKRWREGNEGKEKVADWRKSKRGWEGVGE